ncbi:hypothetical protein J4440_01930 [Candidatus Woesearchaeota archaeon]|nr:hypothetical protein [Candidatus Woesearchaeota archaeon]
MVQNTENRLLDSKILFGLVPKIIDIEGIIFQDEINYYNNSIKQINEFFLKLPKDYNSGLEEIWVHDKSGILKLNNQYDLSVRFKPGFNVLYCDEGLVDLPLYTMLFNYVAHSSTKTILNAALKQFNFLGDDYDVVALAKRNQQKVLEGLALLREILPTGTVINARTNEYLAIGEVTHKLK